MFEISPMVADVEGVEWRYDDVARELQDLAMEEVDALALEAAAQPGLEDEVTDDEIARAAEEIAADEG